MRVNLIQTTDLKMKELLKAVENVAGSKAAILITGESGTGKELLSRYIHNKSYRASRPLYAINCAALPENLLESELFGYEKGAFTGADKRHIGQFEAANGSTFLLDEVSEMPIHLQSKLLRVLQEGEITRLGSTQSIKVDVRIIATSNKDLVKMISAGSFREDLFYRLNVIPLQIPPLRQRLGDLEWLSKYFVALICEENKKNIKILSPEALDKIKKWKWPGNVRELQNVIERSVLMSNSDTLSANEILIKDFQPNQQGIEFQPGLTVAELEKRLILKTLDYTNQNRTQAAHLLGISIRTLRNKIREYKVATEELGVSI